MNIIYILIAIAIGYFISPWLAIGLVLFDIAVGAFRE